MNKILFYKEKLTYYDNKIKSLVEERDNFLLETKDVLAIVEIIEPLLVNICTIPLEFDIYHDVANDIKYLNFDVDGDVDLIFSKINDLYPLSYIHSYDGWNRYILIKL